MCGSDTTIVQQAPEKVNYGEAMREGLEAQIELAPDLYAAEADPSYGRKAYARLNQEVAMDTLLGEEASYDDEGRIIEGYEQAQTGNEAYEIKQRNVKKGDSGFRYTSTLELIDKKTGNVVKSNSFDFETEKGQTVNPTGGDLTGNGKLGSPSNKTAKYQQLRNSALGSFGDVLGEEGVKNAQNAKYLDAVSFSPTGEAIEKTPIYRKDVGGNIITDPSKAGQTTRSGGGLVDVYAGTETFDFKDKDGNTVKRRAGFDEDGNFQGLSKLANDLQTTTNDTRVQGELQLIEEYGNKFTEEYRKQGDIQGALDKVTKLNDQSAIPSQKLDSQGNRLSNLAQSFGSGQQISSVYGNRQNAQQGQQPQQQPQDQQPSSLRQQKGEGQNPQAGDLTGQGKGQTGQQDQQPSSLSQQKGDNRNPQAGDLTGQGESSGAGAMGAVGAGAIGAVLGGAGSFGGAGGSGGSGGKGQNPNPTSGDLTGQEIAEQAQSVGRRVAYNEKFDDSKSMNQTGVTERASSLEGKLEEQVALKPDLNNYGGENTQGINETGGDLSGNGKGNLQNINQTGGDLSGKGKGNTQSINETGGDLSGKGKGNSASINETGGDLSGKGKGNTQSINQAGGDLTGNGKGNLQNINQTGGDLSGQGKGNTASINEQVGGGQAELQQMGAAQAAPQAAPQESTQPAMLTDQQGVGMAQAGMAGRDVDAMEVGNLSGLRSGLNEQAASELAAGGDLTERELRAAQQQARAASTARGRTRDTAGVLDELRNNEMFANQRLRERQAFAQGVSGQEAQLRGMDINSSMQAQMSNQAADLNLGARQGAASAQNQQSQLALTQMDQASQAANQSNELARQQMLLGATEKDIDRGIQVGQINQAFEQSGLQMDRASAAQRVGLEQATSADPMQAITGRPSGAGVVGAGNLYGNAAQNVQTPMMYNPAQGAEFIANQAAGINSYNAAMASAQATASAGKSSMWGSILGGVATGAGMAYACWVAREVFGMFDLRWIQFRTWMMLDSPSWFRKLYMRHGEKFAEWVKDKPWLKKIIKSWMLTKIKKDS